MMPIVLDDVSYRYKDGSLAVENVSMTILDGERVAIVGQNGAGKTTTVTLMNGLLHATSGEVYVDDEPTSGRATAAIAKNVSYVFQNPDDQIAASSVLGELEYMPRYLKWEEETTAQRVKRAVDLTGIGDVLDANPHDLPFAIRKFVAMAASLVGYARFMILDEPTAGLDVRGIELLHRLLDKLRDEGIGVITITHDMRFVVENFARVVVMANKKVVADGRTPEVFANEEVLRRARLRRPEAAQLARDLGLDRRAVRLEEIAAAIP